MASRPTLRLPPPAPLVVAVDGPGGSGKSTVARALARRLGLHYLDTGSTYRALTWYALQRGVDPADGVAIARLLDDVDIEVGTDPSAPTISVRGQRVDREIRGEVVSAAVSAVSAHPAVRRALVRLQQDQIARDGQPLATRSHGGGTGRWTGGVVVEGRDTGAVVAPGAAVKVFLTADEAVRAQRRAHEQGLDGAEAVRRTAAALSRRDHADTARAADPLAMAPDATVIDTSGMRVDDVVERILTLVPAGSTDAGPGSAGSDTPMDTPVDTPVDTPMDTPVDTPAAADAPTVTPRGSYPPYPPYSPVLYRMLRVPARLAARSALRVDVRGLEHVPRTGSVVLAANHSGFLDGPLVAAFAPRLVRILTKVELFRGPLGQLLDRVGQIPVRRGRPDRAALRACVKVLEAGGALGIFPEGTRGAGDLRQVQDGAAYLLLRVDCPVLPVVCTGTSQALPRGARIPRWRAPVAVVFGPPFRVVTPPNPRARSSVASVSEQVRLGMLEHLLAVREGRR